MRLIGKLAVIVIMFAMTSCNHVTNEEIGVPKTVIPESILNQFINYMDIYKGDNPPVIDGEYVSSPHELVYDSDSGMGANSDIAFDDYFFAFTTVDGKLTFRAEENSQTIEASDVTLMGNDSLFTAYFIGQGYSGEIPFKKSYLISGIKTEDGIAEFHYSFIMLEKGDDPLDDLLDVNDYRVIKDGNGMADNWFWQKDKPAAKRMSDDRKLKAE